jgi:YfiH family protein
MSGVRAFFTTRLGGCSSPPFDSLNLGLMTFDGKECVRKNWRTVLEACDLAHSRLYLPKLVHGDKLIKAESWKARDPRPEADAVYLNNSGHVAAITMADCLPVLIYDSRYKTAAAIHAGWKGSRLGIVEKCLTFLFKGGSASPESTFIAFGPCIQRRAFEVGEKVAREFSPGCIHKQNDRFYLDLPKVNALQVAGAGVPLENLEQHTECTYSNPDRFFSHRRDGGNSGRMAALIGLA